MSHSDTEYFQERADRERALARSADKASVAAIHDDLARGYEALVRYEELRPILVVPAVQEERAASG